jgi:type I restriction enzyme M protein
MARLRATASAARSVLDGCEHDGMLSRVGSRLPKLTNRTIKKRETKHIKKQDHAHLLKNFDFHTLLRLPTGIFYKQGVKANVMFFDKKPVSEKANTKDLWIYDLRTNQRFTLKERPMVRADLDDFVDCCASGERRKRKETERFHRFAYADLVARDKANLDIFWLKDDTLDDPDLLPPPEEVAAEIVENLETALERFRRVANVLNRS